MITLNFVTTAKVTYIDLIQHITFTQELPGLKYKPNVELLKKTAVPMMAT